MRHYVIDNEWITIDQLNLIIDSGAEVTLGDNAKEKINNCRAFLDKKVAESDDLIYGVNTGFGSLCNTAISNKDLEKLQRNLVLSHACGTGELVPEHIVRRMLLLKVIGLSFGHSGAQLQTVERLLYFYNNKITPIVYQQGSLGASGDLAPLAHMSLPLLGEGEVYYKGKTESSSDVLKREGLEPLVLCSKEGLALLNGTQFMSAYASYSVYNALQLWSGYNLVGALSLDAYDGRLNPFQSNVNEVNNHVSANPP